MQMPTIAERKRSHNNAARALLQRRVSRLQVGERSKTRRDFLTLTRARARAHVLMRVGLKKSGDCGGFFEARARLHVAE